MTTPHPSEEIFLTKRLEFPRDVGSEVFIKIFFIKIAFILPLIGSVQEKKYSFPPFFSFSIKLTSGFSEDFWMKSERKIFEKLSPPPILVLQSFENLKFLGGDLWEAFGDNPEFILKSKNYPPGWYKLQADLKINAESKEAAALNPKLYIEREDGSREESRAAFSSGWKGKLNAYFFLPSGAKRICFNPTGSRSLFHLSGLRLWFTGKETGNEFLIKHSSLQVENHISEESLDKRPLCSTENKTVVITGMHRSGTSMISRILNSAEYYLGEEEELLEPDSDNEMGFWENKNFILINDKILSTLKGNWHTIPHFPKDWLEKKEIIQLKKEAVKMMRKFKEYKKWGWKDPRTALTLPFWKEILSELFPTNQIYYLLCIRNPMDVAKSLRSRNGFSLEQGLRLWEEYTRAAVHYTKNEKRIILKYENFFSNPEQEIKKIYDFLKDDCTSKQIQKSLNLINGKIKHHETPVQELLENNQIPESIKALYALVSAPLNGKAKQGQLCSPPSLHTCYSVGAPILQNPNRILNGVKAASQKIADTCVQPFSSKIRMKREKHLKKDLENEFSLKNYEKALKISQKILWNSWIKFQEGGKEEIQEANFTVNKVIKEIAAGSKSLQNAIIPSSSSCKNGKTKLAFIKGGIIPNDGPTAVLLSFCRENNRNIFSLQVYDTHSPESRQTPNSAVMELKRWGIPYHFSDHSTLIERSEDLCVKIQKDETDIAVIFGSMLDIPSRYIACRKPAKTMIHYDLMQDTGLTDVFDAVIATEKNQMARHADKKASCYIQGEPSDIKKRIQEFRENGLVIQRCCLGFDKNSIILGTFGRLKKIVNPSFLNILSKMLLKFPKTCYITAGPGDAAEIAKISELEKKFPGRVKYLGNIGHLEANLLILLDIYLNSFPLPGGQSYVNALGAGLPAVTIPSFGGAAMGNTFSDEIEGYPPFPSENLEDGYWILVQKTIEEKEFRDYIGKVCTEYFNRFLDAEVRVPVYEKKWLEIFESSQSQLIDKQHDF